MRLAHKSFFIITTTLSVLICIQFFFLRNVLLDGFNYLEKMDAQKNISRVKDAIKDELSHHDTKLIDWSEWDDAYKFIQDDNNDFKKANLGDRSLINLKINFFIFIKKNGDIAYERMVDLSGKIGYSTPQEFLQQIQKDNKLNTFPSKTDHVNGVIMFNDTPMLISSQPILKTDGTGPVVGTIIAGKFINDEIIQHISNITYINFSIATPHASKKSISPEWEKIVSFLKDEDSSFIDVASNENLYGYSLLKDIYGENAFYIKVSIPRDVHRHAEATLISFLMTIIIGGIFIVFVTNFITNRLIVHPIISLNKRVNEITRNNDISLRINSNGNDEINDLSQEINSMLNAIEESKKSTQLLLDNISQGFFIFDRNGIIAPKFSKAVLDIFIDTPNPSGLHISTLFKQPLTSWNEYIASLFNEDLPFADLIYLCPKTIEIFDRHIELNYKAIRKPPSNKISYIMVMATDVTELKKLQQQKEEERKFNNSLIKILIFKTEFIKAVDITRELEEFQEKSYQISGPDLTDLKSKLRTIKEAFTFLGLNDLAEQCRHHEERVRETPCRETLLNIISSLNDEVTNFIERYDNLLKIKGFTGESIGIPSETLHHLLETGHHKIDPIV